MPVSSQVSHTIPIPCGPPSSLTSPLPSLDARSTLRAALALFTAPSLLLTWQYGRLEG